MLKCNALDFHLWFGLFLIDKSTKTKPTVKSGNIGYCRTVTQSQWCARFDLVTSPCYQAPGDLWVKLTKVKGSMIIGLFSLLRSQSGRPKLALEQPDKSWKVPDVLFQKQPFKGVLKKRRCEYMQQIFRRTLMPKCDFEILKSHFGMGVLL